MKLAVSSLLLAASALAVAPIHVAPTVESGVPHEFLVVLEKGQKGLAHLEEVTAAAKAAGVKVFDTFNIGEGRFSGFSGYFPDEAVFKVARMEGVKEIHQDQYTYAAQTCSPVTAGGHWGLDFADGNFDDQYCYSDLGSGTTVYVLDTGIRITHNDFGGRAVYGANYASNGDPSDGHGHGTHCAGTASGGSHGIARESRVSAVKVLGDNGSGQFAWSVSGINFSAGDCPSDVCVASMSLGGGIYTPLHDAIEAAYRGGTLITVVASGNNGGNSCNYSPAAAEYAYTVNSAQRSGNTVSRSSFSNYGDCSNTFSAGSSVLSAHHTSDTATATMSGTSMACPHVAGHAATCAASSSTAEAAWTCLDGLQVEGVVGGTNPVPNLYTQTRA